MSNYKEQRKIQEIVEIRELLNKFCVSYRHIVHNALQYGDNDVRIRLRQIENLFSPYLGEDQRSLKAKKFHTPLSFVRYVEFKKMRDWMVYHKNKEFKKAIKEIGSIYERQWFRNIEIFRLIIIGMEKYLSDLKKNQCLKALEKQKNYVGFQARLFRKRRIKEAKELIKDLDRIKEVLKKELFINDIERYITLYMDFFIQCRFKLEKFANKINISINSIGDLSIKKLVIKDTDDKKVSLELPGWNQISKFE